MKTLMKSILLSYGQIFFSYQKWFSIALIAITFFKWEVGLFGLIGVTFANVIAIHLRYNSEYIQNGYYGFNALLVSMEIAFFFKPSFTSVLLLFVMVLSTVLLSAVISNLFKVYFGLPMLSLPFVLISILLYFSTYNYTGLTLNEVNSISLISGYSIWAPIILYFQALGIIFFQTNIWAGVIIAVLLGLYSRIFLFLSLSGFLMGMAFYNLMGGSLEGVENAFIGFNFIFIAMSIGGVFFVPSVSSYILAMIATMMVALSASAIKTFVIFYGMPVFALPFNLMVFVIILAYKQRGVDIYPKMVDFVPGKPENNLNYYLKNIKRFGNISVENHLLLPVKGIWKVTQGVEGEHTHKGLWKWALDFQKLTYDKKLYRNTGDYLDDYPTFKASVYSPVDGVVVAVENNIKDNDIGNVDTVNNWGNYIIIYASYGVYVKVAHLLHKSTNVVLNQKVQAGERIGSVGNSGRSPYPHLHMQVQMLPVVGSVTRPFKLKNYIRHSEDERLVIYNELPKENDIVENIEYDQVFSETFNLYVNRMFQFTLYGKKETVVSKVDFYGRTYLESDNDAKLYFSKDAYFFYFLDFEGNKKSALYEMYRTVPRIPLQYREGIKWEEKIYYPGNVFQKMIDDFVYFILPPRLKKIQCQFTKKTHFGNQVCYKMTQGERDLVLHPKHFIMQLTNGTSIVEQMV